MKTFAASVLLATLAVADIPAVTITTAPAEVQSALVSYFSDYDHHTLGVNMTVGAAISSVYMASAAYPTAADVVLNVRSHINFAEGPTPLFKDLENPSSVISSIAAQLPTVAPFPDALAVIYDLYAHLGDIASSELNRQTTLVLPPGWSLESAAAAASASSVAAASATASSAVVASECPAKTVDTAAKQTTAAAAATATPQQQAENGVGGQASLASLAPAALIVMFCAGVMAL